jgi:hypothetical protein
LKAIPSTKALDGVPEFQKTIPASRSFEETLRRKCLTQALVPTPAWAPAVSLRAKVRREWMAGEPRFGGFLVIEPFLSDSLPDRRRLHCLSDQPNAIRQFPLALQSAILRWCVVLDYTRKISKIIFSQLDADLSRWLQCCRDWDYLGL